MFTLTHEDGTSTSVQNTSSLAEALALFGLNVHVDIQPSASPNKWYIERLTDGAEFILRRH